LTDSVFDGEVLLDLFGRRVGLLYGWTIIVVGRWWVIGLITGFVGWVDIDEFGLYFLH
jgi:hypothetical protein